MTGHVVRHGADRSGEVRVEFARRLKLGEVLEEIPGVRRDELGVVGAVEPGVFPLEHIAAGRSGHDDLAPLSDRRREAPDVVPDEGLRFVHRTAIEIRHAAAALGWQTHVDAVPLEHADRGAPRRRLVVVDAARREQRDFPCGGHRGRRAAPRARARRGRPLRVAFEPGGERRALELGQVPFLVDTRYRLHERAMHTELVHPVRQGCAEAPEPADEVRVAEKSVLKRDAVLPRLGGAGAQHEPREVDLPAVRRCIRAVIETELALVAEVDDFLDVRCGQLFHVAVDGVDIHPIEQHFERRAERQTPPTAAAYVIDPPQLLVDGAELPELRILDIETRHDGTERLATHELAAGGAAGGVDRTRSRKVGGGRRAPGWSPAAAGPASACRVVRRPLPLPRPSRARRQLIASAGSLPAICASPLLNRPAWDFSALASVSSHSASSLKPSPRAVLAIPGYICVYSYVSPATAALRFSSVLPIGSPVAGSPTSFRNLRFSKLLVPLRPAMISPSLSGDW